MLISSSLKIGLQKPKIWAKMAIILFKYCLSAICVTIATVKFTIMPKFYTSVIAIINQSIEIGEKQFLVFGYRRGPN